MDNRFRMVGGWDKFVPVQQLAVWIFRGDRPKTGQAFPDESLPPKGQYHRFCP